VQERATIKIAPPGLRVEDAALLRGEGQFIDDLGVRPWKRPDADRKSLIEGWYFTGDIGHFDKDVDLFVTGRVDDMMISGGENVLPVEIESLLSLPRLRDRSSRCGLAR